MTNSILLIKSAIFGKIIKDLSMDLNSFFIELVILSKIFIGDPILMKIKS